jgi:hypothetical protein
MNALPKNGDLVKIFPFPGRLVQHGPSPVMRPAKVGGPGMPITGVPAVRWMPKEGVEVIWSDWELHQLRAGDILLHAPLMEDHEPKKVTAPGRHKFDPVAAAQLEQKHREDALEAEKKDAPEAKPEEPAAAPAVITSSKKGKE